MSRHNLAVVYVCVRASACHIYSLFVHAGGWASISLTRTFSLSHDLSLSLFPPSLYSIPFSLTSLRSLSLFLSLFLSIAFSLVFALLL